MGVKASRRSRPQVPVEVSPQWRAWVHRCVRLGAWAILMAGVSLVVVVLLMADQVHWPAGADYSWPVVLLALVDLLAMLVLARGWLWPRWPDQPPSGSVGAALDPLGNTLPAISLGILGVNVAWGLAAGGLLRVIQVSFAVVGLGLLGGSIWQRPSEQAHAAGGGTE